MAREPPKRLQAHFSYEAEEAISRMQSITSSHGESTAQQQLDTVDDLLRWAAKLQAQFQSSNIPRRLWPDVAIRLLGNSGRELQIKVLVEYKRSQFNAALGHGDDAETRVWDWDSFLNAVKEIIVSFDEPNRLQRLQEDYKDAIRLAGKGLIGVGVIALGPAAAIIGLNALGFSAAGIVGGSIAASLQSTVYGGATAGLFSACQSFAASAALPAMGTLGGAAGSILAGVGILGKTTSKDSDSNKENSNASLDTESCDDKSTASSGSSSKNRCKCE